MRNRLAFLGVLLSISCSAEYPVSPTSVSTVASIAIFYNTPHQWVNPGNTVSMSLYALNTDGVYENVTTRASWFSADTSVATVTNGTARGVSGGSAEIVASYQGLTSTARVVVLVPNSVRYPWLDIRSYSPPETGRSTSPTVGYFTAANAAQQNVQSEAVLASSDPSVIKIEGGRVIGVGPGTAAITATYRGLTAMSYLSVQPIRVLP
jgi:hypothetical protein